MNEHLKRTLRVFPAVAPIIVSLMFFGLLSPRYTVTLYTSNIEGEGICTTYLCPSNAFSPFYESGFYFGSELQKATITGIHWDVRDLSLSISDVPAMELEGYDVSVFGIPLQSYRISNMVSEGEYAGVTARLTDDGERVRFEFENTNESFTLNLATGFAPTWFWVAYIATLIIVALLVSIVIGILIKDNADALILLYCAAGTLVSLVAGYCFCGSLAYIEYGNFLLGWALVAGASLILSAITLPWVGTGIIMLVVLAWNIVNYYVIKFRGKPITPYDFAAAGTAREVAGGYDFTPSWQIIVSIIVVLVYIILIFIVCRKRKNLKTSIQEKNQLRKRVITALCGIALIIVSYISPAYKSLETFAWDAVLLKSYHEEGAIPSFLKALENSGVKEPEGYSREIVNKYLEEYLASEKDETSEGALRPTRILMVMDEAFSDLRTVGLDPQIDVMPFIDSLDQNTIEGSLYVSIFGGGTCNSEFEALTGNSLAFLGPGSYPYVEYVTRPLFSLASYLKSIGYETTAFHANEPTNWNRDRAYPNLGFDNFHSINDYPTLTDEYYLHGHPADIADYTYMEQVSEESGSNPEFLFCVTMQNHSGYERWEDVQEAQSVQDNAADLYVDSRVYLSLIKASDDAVKQLMETYKDDVEPTMIVYFGDHQPGLPSAARDEIYTAAESYLDMYKTKFFIWTNYDTESQHDVSVSANYLPWLVLERGNFELPPYVQMLREVHGQYPIITSQGVIDSEGNMYSGVDDERIYGNALIQKYRYVQYANMFDEIDEKWFEVE